MKKDLFIAFSDLFSALNTTKVHLDDCMEVSVTSFINDFLKNIDEIKVEEDIVQLWQVKKEIASMLFSLLNELFHETLKEDNGCCTNSSDNDSFDESDDEREEIDWDSSSEYSD